MNYPDIRPSQPCHIFSSEFILFYRDSALETKKRARDGDATFPEEGLAVSCGFSHRHCGKQRHIGAVRNRARCLLHLARTLWVCPEAARLNLLGEVIKPRRGSLREKIHAKDRWTYPGRRLNFHQLPHAKERSLHLRIHNRVRILKHKRVVHSRWSSRDS